MGAGVLLAGLVAYNAPLWTPAVLSRVRAWADEGSRGGSGGSGGANGSSSGGGGVVNVVT